MSSWQSCVPSNGTQCGPLAASIEQADERKTMALHLDSESYTSWFWPCLYMPLQQRTTEIERRADEHVEICLESCKKLGGCFCNACHACYLMETNQPNRLLGSSGLHSFALSRFFFLLFCFSCLGCATAHLCSPQGFAAHELCKGLLKRSATCRSCMQDFQKTQLSKISGAIWTAAGLGFFFSTHMLDMLVILWPNKHTLARALFTVEGETSKIPVGKDRRDLRRSAASVPWAVIPSCVKLARNDKKMICEAFKGWRSSKCEASLAEVSCIMSEAADSSTQCLLNYLRCIYSHSMSVFPARFAFIRKKLAKS